ncbi:MAG: prolipoprotein diacylglyceryl transferase [Alphaproteobacteria bacterium]|nr:prolipoprotein diacylglyceryl transferase [Alphaproteobacteria bacterium]MBU1515699.1 prolipoprotein diacylglyceryl transferase [Alphaproteobacteria bacterium]MBU2096982.1 prolipoprotein diacylglyceryl transferase [Alphaproteobacteria bacterium]MBU2149498.1 prolipoprotein diacylglyceryl transferase [Alphaproteobacteria bacterium]MBU2308884.1 prolipoprotein diacylglyceryl transferase [Alphaproteobacteria bacterium]
MPFPNIDPILVQLGPFAIRWYALAYVAGILLGWRYATGLLRNTALWTHRPAPFTPEQMDDLILWIAIGVIGGGRLGHVLFYTPGMLATDPLGVFKVWEGGMSFHGGVIGVSIAMIGFAWRNKLDLLRIADVVAPAYPIGHFLGRCANFINGELWGRPTDEPWGMVFCNDQIRETFGYCPAGEVARHPSQLYEAAFEGLILFLILRWATHSAKLGNRRGVITGIFIAFYGVFRIAIETVREPDQGMPNFPFGLTMGMILSIPMVLGGLFLIWRGMREPLPPALPAATGEPAPTAA